MNTNDTDLLRHDARVTDVEDELRQLRRWVEQHLGPVPGLEPLEPAAVVRRWQRLTRAEVERAAMDAGVDVRTVRDELAGRPGKASVRRRVCHALQIIVDEINAPEPRMPKDPGPGFGEDPLRHGARVAAYERSLEHARKQHAEWTRRRDARARQLKLEPNEQG